MITEPVFGLAVAGDREVAGHNREVAELEGHRPAMDLEADVDVHLLVLGTHSSVAWPAPVMVAGHEVLVSWERCDGRQPLGDATHRNITEHPDLVVLANGASPVGEQRFVRRLYGRKGPVAEADDVDVAEVQVGREEAHVSRR